MKKFDNDKIKKILVFQTAFLGDTVLSTPLFKNIKKHFNNAEITALVIPSNEPIISGNPYVDKIITYDKKSAKKLRGFLSTRKLIKKERFDLVFSLHRSLRTALLLYLSGIPIRVGFCDSAFSVLYNLRIKRDLTQHDVKRNLSILTGGGMKEADLTDELLVTYSQKDKESVLSKMGDALPKNRPIIVVNPGSVWATKRYPYESFAKVISLLNELDKYRIVLTGGKDDIETAEKIMNLCGGKITNLTGKTSLKELSALLDSSALMITNDSGPLHIAASYNTPIVAIFGATTRELGFFPYNKNSVAIEKSLPCRPCGKHGGNKCPIGTFDCMRLIRPEEIYQSALKMLTKE